jgi:hypothetical protein
LAYVGYQAKLREDKSVPDTQRYKLVYIVLPSNLAATKDAIFEAGGGIVGLKEIANLCKVAYEITRRAKFIPMAEAGAVPHTGTPGMLEETEEVRVEIMCSGRKVTKAAVEGLKRLVGRSWPIFYANHSTGLVHMKFVRTKFKQRRCATATTQPRPCQLVHCKGLD